MRAKLEAELREQISQEALESFKSSASFQACVDNVCFDYIVNGFETCKVAVQEKYPKLKPHWD